MKINKLPKSVHYLAGTFSTVTLGGCASIGQLETRDRIEQCLQEQGIELVQCVPGEKQSPHRPIFEDPRFLRREIRDYM